jgi:Zn-dependent peptidase ImmA (M78 family)
MRPDIWDRLSRDDPWARFTGAHEIGHGAMHIYEVAVDLPNGKLVGLRRSSSIPSGRDPERQADRFASYFLMPTQPFMLALESFGPNARALAEVFGTSLKATSIRLGDFGYR